MRKLLRLLYCIFIEEVMRGSIFKDTTPHNFFYKVILFDKSIFWLEGPVEMFISSSNLVLYLL